MRLLLLPISTRRTLIYSEPLALSSHTKPSPLDRIVVYANARWAEWEKSTDSYMNWKQRTTAYGNMMFRRIPYQEWGLKSIPQRSRIAGPLRQGEKVDVQFPALYQGLCKEGVLDTLKRLATERQALHRKRMLWSLVAMPLTAPVALLPIIPNLPFFYLVFRAYSHWRALSGSRSLSDLLTAGSLRLTPTSTLDTLYTAGLLYPTRAASRDAPEPTQPQTQAVVECLRQQTSPSSASSTSTSASASSTSASAASTSAGSSTASAKASGAAPPTNAAGAKLLPGQGKRLHTGEEEVMLLQGWNGKLLAERVKLPGLEIEIERAVEQVQDSIEKDEGELLGEKKELEDLTQRFRARSKAANAA